MKKIALDALQTEPRLLVPGKLADRGVRSANDHLPEPACPQFVQHGCKHSLADTLPLAARFDRDRFEFNDGFVCGNRQNDSGNRACVIAA